jgi:hypothetical protein
VSSAALEERHKIGCKRKGRVDFALFNIHASPNTLMPQTTSVHGGVAEPIRHWIARHANIEGKRKSAPTEGFAISCMEEMC